MYGLANASRSHGSTFTHPLMADAQHTHWKIEKRPAIREVLFLLIMPINGLRGLRFSAQCPMRPLRENPGV